MTESPGGESPGDESPGGADLAAGPGPVLGDRAGKLSLDGSLSDHAMAAALATDAGMLLLGVRDTFGFGRAGILKSAGDRWSHELLMTRLAMVRPRDSVLSEEGADDERRLSADRVWIVDPVDGTREFSEAGRVDWAVHVALWEQGELVAGAVALPAAGLTLATGAALPVRQAVSAPIRLVVSRTRPPELVSAIVPGLGAELVPMGSAGAKVMAVVRGEADAYVHGGGQYEWDSAAPVAVARAAGLHTSRLDGSPLVYNQRDVLLPDLIVCAPEIADRVLAEVAAAL